MNEHWNELFGYMNSILLTWNADMRLITVKISKSQKC